jgi:hypothetical protein
MIKYITFPIGLLCTIALAQQPAAPPTTDWVPISEPLIKQLQDQGKKIDWPGLTAGVVVDRTSGRLYMIVPGQGIWTSTNRGQTFARADGGEIGGRCETGYALNADPAGRRLACFMLDGKCGLTLDGGKTWQRFADVGRNWDFAAVDWSVPKPTAIFAARHESGGEMFTSTNAGQTWTQIGKDPKFAAVGIFDAKTLVTTKGDGLLRSTDGGQTWARVSDFTPVGRVMVIFKGTAYWVAKDGIITSRDEGLTWEKWGTPVTAGWGPLFGKDAQHMIVASKMNILETTDGGQTWKTVVALPKLKGFEPGNPGWFMNLAYDPVGDVFYVSRMSCHTYKFERAPR